VADFTYLRCWEGLVYFAFVVDVYSRMICGWQLAAHMRTDLVLDALRMALGLRGPGADVQLVHHSDRGSQYTSGDYTQTLEDHRVLASVGSVGDAYDNALAESFVDSFRTELVADRVWRTRSQLELATVEYVGWFNTSRLHESLGDIPPVEHEALSAAHAPGSEHPARDAEDRGAQTPSQPLTEGGEASNPYPKRALRARRGRPASATVRRADRPRKPKQETTKNGPRRTRSGSHPTLVIIREPYVTLRQALWAYAAFYTALNELGDRVVVGDFGDITTDVGGVIDRVNDCFGTSFARFVHTPHTTAECFRIIDDRARRPPWDDHIGAFLAGTEDIHQLRRARQEWQAHHPDRLPIPEDRVARPSQSRQRIKARLRRNYASAELAATRTRAEHAYTRFLRAASRTRAVLVAIGLSTEWCRLVPG
jgi:hypothetical protein